MAARPAEASTSRPRYPSRLGPVALHRLVAVGLPLLLSLGAFALYLRTAARTISWGNGGEDGPELSAAAAVLGVAHPPGYPLYMLLGHLFAQLPVGEVAFRVGLLSAVAAAVGVALAAGLSALLAAPGTQNPSPIPSAVAALAAGGVLATSPLYWSQATIPEVYTLHAALVLAALLLLASWRPYRDRLVVAVALLFGIGLGNHPTLALLALPAAAFVVAREPATLRRSTALLAPVAFAAGLSIYLYLPLRAAADPPLNWGDPSDLPRFLAHVTASGYRPYWGGRPWSEVAARIPAMAQLLVAQLTWPGLVLALLGLGELARRSPALFRMLLAYLLLTLGFTLFYNAENGQVYLLPAVLVLAVSLGVGAAHVASLGVGTPHPASPGVGTPHPAASWPGTLIALVAAIAIPAVQFWTCFAPLDLSSDHAAASYARDTLSGAAPNALLITDRDEQTFVLWYAQVVEGRRPDVVVVDRRLLATDWFRSQLQQRHPGVLERVSP